MKLLLLLAGISMALIVDEQSKEGEDFNSDFMQGMENGFLLRDNPEAYKEYECPEVTHHEDWQKKVTTYFEPVKMIVKLVSNDIFIAFWTVIEILIPGIVDLTATYSNDYKGSNYCSGLMFGMIGTKMLLSVAKQFLKVVDVLEEERLRNLEPEVHFVDEDEWDEKYAHLVD